MSFLLVLHKLGGRGSPARTDFYTFFLQLIPLKINVY